MSDDTCVIQIICWCLIAKIKICVAFCWQTQFTAYAFWEIILDQNSFRESLTSCASDQLWRLVLGTWRAPVVGFKRLQPVEWCLTLRLRRSIWSRWDRRSKWGLIIIVFIVIILLIIITTSVELNISAGRNPISMSVKLSPDSVSGTREGLKQVGWWNWLGATQYQI